MRRYLLVLSIGFVLIFLVSAPQVRADGVDTFTFTEANFNGSSQLLTVTWQLPSSPTSLALSSDGLGFETNPVPITATLGGLTETLPDTFVFLNSSLGGGFFEGNGIFFTTPGGAQLYSGFETGPTFTPGTYNGFDSGFGGEATLAIATPEPSALLLLLSGLAAFLICLTLKKQIL
jgi:hypothetical protein